MECEFMKNRTLAAVAVIGSIVAASATIYAAEGYAPVRDVRLSPDLLGLLRSEMREIASGIQGVPLSLATADWKSIQETSAKIQSSYIMEKNLTVAQADELRKALPGEFRQLDAEFHLRAERLGAAAAAHDPELVAYHFSRLVESCTRCHAVFASKRFPGFSSRVSQEHHH
jgi:cytochrome c556